MKTYYLSNIRGEIEKAQFENDAEAFREAQRRNKKPQNQNTEFRFLNWKAYDERGDLIYYVSVNRGR